MAEHDTLWHINKRYNDMRSERDKFLVEWETDDLQYEAETYEDNMWNLHVNTPMEQNLTEMELWRTAGLPLFDVQPDGYRADVQKLETARYILHYFIDKEQRYKENRRWKMDKSKYGTGIFFTGIRMEIDIVPEYWEWEEESTKLAFWNHKKAKETQKINWSFTPQNVPIRMFLFDDRAMRQSNFDRAQDCIMLEFLTKEELTTRYWDNKYFNKKVIEWAVETQIEEGEYGILTEQPMIVLYHYFNKSTKQYAIVINKTDTLFDWKMLYKDWKLPFVVCQHYPNNACIYGIGIPRKVRAEKAYTNNMKQYMLDWARLWSGKILAMGNSWEVVDWNLSVWAWQINIARFSNSIEQVKEISTGVDLNWPLAVLNMLKDDVRGNTGIDLNAVFEPPANQLGTVEIIEENKQIRSKSVDELMDFAYDEALTKMLDNIAIFAPRLLKTTKKVKDKKGKVIKEVHEYPKLQIPNVKITKKKGKQYIEEEMWEYGYLDFTPETLEGWMCVRVVTGTTANTRMQIIEKNKTNEFIQRYIQLTQVVWPEKMEEVFPMDQVLEKWKVVYGYDDKKLVADTKKDKIRRDNEEKLALLKEMMSNEITEQDEWMAMQGQATQISSWIWDDEIWATNIEEATQSIGRWTQRIQAEIWAI
jgi:hypothetical protein